MNEYKYINSDINAKEFWEEKYRNGRILRKIHKNKSNLT